jgi:FixJ family two-component response regulator
VTRSEPDVILLDGDGGNYGGSWLEAAWMRERTQPIAVIMFTAHMRDLAEAEMAVSERAKKAAFVGIVAKPFDLQTLIDTVERGVNEARAARDRTPEPR